ncbi:unknown [Clostridium sp. CAG:715]|nr:unknown [Clostridium sp. CAG:715]
MKKLLITALILNLILPVSAISLDDVAMPKQPAYRTGLSEEPEKEYMEVKAEDKIKQEYVKKDAEQFDVSDLTYADLSIKQISREVAADLELDQEDMVGDLSVLWQGAASQSDTINFALYKLANPDEDKPDEKSVKKVLTTIASMSTLVGAGMGNPLLAGGSLIGGNILGIMSQDTKALNYKYTKVTDADMIILVRKIEDLQQRTVDLYYNYMMARKRLKMIEQITADRKKNYDLSQTMSKEVILITDAYYRTALDNQMKARSDYYAKRAALEQFVGNDTFAQFEKDLKERENSEK